MNIEPGNPFPLGATCCNEGINFCLYADNATSVELCLFDSVNDKHESQRVKMKQRTHCVWHSFISGLKAGQLYAYRVYGPYEPHNGHRFNPNKLLLDPYAKAITGLPEWRDEIFGYDMKDPQDGNSFSKTDSVPFMPKCVVIDDAFDWENDVPPKTKYHNSIIYELHVKGFTHLHPSIPKEIRGTYAALAHPETIKYFKTLGITALELMPVQYFLNEGLLIDEGLKNYWGYNTVGYFAPDVRYAGNGTTGEQVTEFKQMVKALHKEGIEVLMDVVYNHTGEGNHLGPTVCFRGIDNASYYRLEKDKRLYKDFTGTGNTLNSGLFGVLRMIMDSVRYWVKEMHVDGFRFDLAATLARTEHDINMLNAFFHIIYQDPVLSKVKLIAEPWDVGDDGYQIGEFPQYWVEWNGKFRDDVRSFWNETYKKDMDFIARFSGSPDLYKQRNRYPTASVNFVTAHDGFTLHDLVSYNQKHNELNKHDNKDGSDENYSFNFGVEGSTKNISVNELRKRQKRNFLATLFLSQGTPMLLAGDELGRTQQGNNNAYCQDNELSWINWNNIDDNLQNFCKSLIQFRKDHAVFSRHCWFSDKTDDQLPDVEWFLQNGMIIQKNDWHNCTLKCIGIFLKGNAVDDCSYDVEKLNDENFFVVFNAAHQNTTFKLPSKKYCMQWKKILNTCNENFRDDEIYQHDVIIQIPALSIIILKSLTTE